MRVKRAVVVASLFVSLASGSAFGFFAFLDSSSTAASSEPAVGEEGIPPAPTLGRDVGTAADERLEDPSLTGFFIWAGAIASGAVFLVSVVLFRVEVRREKDLLRVRRQRQDYHRELRKYNNQLKGPPRHNT